ncbi:UDP-N-acetylglucosamine pyrophosphorylase [uncultured delta proteobacterium]|uniref:UDP-N-acetylglucosamine pyrophosphorylase n=1 Tax=uncultured delta proteobacterium TaxID=34034 RepID=A0A212JAN3_9DELT|nr:UDP-N-acetylglucosamine pyrophosphorylase [uncultured delta proteobacterium]
MELRPALRDKIEVLTGKGVTFCNPYSVDIGDDVNTGQIAGDGVTIYPGCRIYGAKTVISAGAQIGREGPVTIEDCQIGPRVELKGGYFSKSVFLARANLGSGAQVREACILEEEAGGAHCVGLKQTILFPFVTLGSLVNFCDCLMAGGTSRKNHSEVGSSYIHFNFTPDGDKTTASLLGDVPRGVMLNQPPIFLGGQGGMVGPLRMGFGNVVAAGGVLRKDVLADGRLVIPQTPPAKTIEYAPKAYPGLARIVRNNFFYLANLTALEQWYIHVRQSFFQEQEFGGLIFRGALETLAMATKERCKRLEDMGNKLAAPPARSGEPGRREMAANAAGIRDLLAGFANGAAGQTGERHKDLFLAGLRKNRQQGAGYIETIQSLPEDTVREGTLWLERIVAGAFRLLASRVPALELTNDAAVAAKE